MLFIAVFSLFLLGKPSGGINNRFIIIIMVKITVFFRLNHGGGGAVNAIGICYFKHFGAFVKGSAGGRDVVYK